jgi:hypothetical protein
MKDNPSSWKKSYSLVLLLNVIYILLFYFLMQIF